MSEQEQGKGKSGEGEEKKPELRKISDEELEEILWAHEKWVEEGMDLDKPGQADLSGKELKGAYLARANLQRAKLYRANLQEADLESANLQEAYLRNANLQGADLRSANLQVANLSFADLRGAYLARANLQGAILFSANLQGADLTLADLTNANLAGAKLQGAILRHTNLSEALHLDVRELAGMDLYMTKLPEEVARFEGLGTVKEAAQKASHLFTILLLCCLFAWLTVGFGVIAAKEGALGLPFINNAQIKEQGFCLLAPVFLLGLFFYFQMYLQRLWEPLALLPAIFPDGTPLDKKAHPWLPIGYVRAHVPRLRQDRPPFSKLQTLLIQIVVYVFAPVSVGLFWWHGLSGGSWLTTAYQAVLTWLACLIAEAFIYQARHTLRREEPPVYRAAKGWRKRVSVFMDTHAWALARLFIYAELLVAGSIANWPG